MLVENGIRVLYSRLWFERFTQLNSIIYPAIVLIEYDGRTRVTEQRKPDKSSRIVKLLITSSGCSSSGGINKLHKHGEDKPRQTYSIWLYLSMYLSVYVRISFSSKHALVYVCSGTLVLVAMLFRMVPSIVSVAGVSGCMFRVHFNSTVRN